MNFDVNRKLTFNRNLYTYWHDLLFEQARFHIASGNKDLLDTLNTNKQSDNSAVYHSWINSILEGILHELDEKFEIAEEDLKIRGPGDFMGTRQSGLPILKIANLMRDIKILDIARKEAFSLIDQDPTLTDSANQPLKNAVHRIIGQYLPLMEII